MNDFEGLELLKDIIKNIFYMMEHINIIMTK